MHAVVSRHELCAYRAAGITYAQVLENHIFSFFFHRHDFYQWRNQDFRNGRARAQICL